MLVRLAYEPDEAAFVELSRQGHAESMSTSPPFEDDCARQTFHSYLERADPTIFVVERHREVVGFLMATMSGYRHAHGLYTTQEVLFVRSDCRGTRAAANLLDEFISWSDRLGAWEITGGNDNGLFTERTARLLEKKGFERVGIFMRRSRPSG